MMLERTSRYAEPTQPTAFGWRSRREATVADAGRHAPCKRRLRRRHRRRRVQGPERRGPTDRDDDDRRPTSRGGGPHPGRALRGRLHNERRKPSFHEHSGGTPHPDSGADPCPRPTSRQRKPPATGPAPPCETYPATAPQVDPESGHRAGAPRPDHPQQRHGRLLPRRRLTLAARHEREPSTPVIAGPHVFSRPEPSPRPEPFRGLDDAQPGRLATASQPALR